MSGFIDFGFGQGDDKLSGKKEKFRGRKGEVSRLSFAHWPVKSDGSLDLDADTPKFVGAKRFYKQGVGYFLDKGAEFEKVAGQRSKVAIATVVIKWPTDRDGELDKANLLKKFKVLPWVFSNDKLVDLKGKHRNFPFGEFDVEVNCTDEQFQKMTFGSCRESLLRAILNNEQHVDVANKIREKIAAVAEGLPNLIAQDLDIDTVRERAGLQAPSGGMDFNDTSDDTSSVLDSVLG